MNKKFFIAMFAISMAAVASSVITMDDAFAGAEVKDNNDRVDYQSFMSETKLTVAQGENRTITADLFAKGDENLNLKTGFAAMNRIGYSIAIGESGLPDGITTNMNKNQIQLVDRGDSEKSVRDSVEIQLNIAENTKPGTYDLAYFVYEVVEEGKALVSGENIQVEVIPLS